MNFFIALCPFLDQRVSRQNCSLDTGMMSNRPSIAELLVLENILADATSTTQKFFYRSVIL